MPPLSQPYYGSRGAPTFSETHSLELLLWYVSPTDTVAVVRTSRSRMYVTAIKLCALVGRSVDRSVDRSVAAAVSKGDPVINAPTINRCRVYGGLFIDCHHLLRIQQPLHGNFLILFTGVWVAVYHSVQSVLNRVSPTYVGGLPSEGQKT